MHMRVPPQRLCHPGVSNIIAVLPHHEVNAPWVGAVMAAGAAPPVQLLLAPPAISSQAAGASWLIS